MKRGLLILILALATGIAAFFLTRAHEQAKSQEFLLDSMPELAWLRRELNLDDGKLQKVADLHAACRPQCAEMCRRISEFKTKLDSIAMESRNMSSELNQVIQDLSRVREDCRSHMLAHIYQIASLMNEKQASRYLETVFPAALGSSNCGAKSCANH